MIVLSDPYAFNPVYYRIAGMSTQSYIDFSFGNLNKNKTNEVKEYMNMTAAAPNSDNIRVYDSPEAGQEEDQDQEPGRVIFDNPGPDFWLFEAVNKLEGVLGQRPKNEEGEAEEGEGEAEEGNGR